MVAVDGIWNAAITQVYHNDWIWRYLSIYSKTKHEGTRHEKVEEDWDHEPQTDQAAQRQFLAQLRLLSRRVLPKAQLECKDQVTDPRISQAPNSPLNRLTRCRMPQILQRPPIGSGPVGRAGKSQRASRAPEGPLVRLLES